MADVINIKCPNCGGVMELLPNAEKATCINCGKKVAIVSPQTQYPSYKEETKIPCPHCSGKGQFFCNYCNGSGRCYYYLNKVHADHRVYAHYCMGGMCPVCKGTGSEVVLIKCSLCHGSGKCPSCLGSARCRYCGGNGIAKCTSCSGTGYTVYR
jgi:DNA-directed RNA polymerase subunit RPC12/RpoP